MAVYIKRRQSLTETDILFGLLIGAPNYFSSRFFAVLPQRHTHRYRLSHLQRGLHLAYRRSGRFAFSRVAQSPSSSSLEHDPRRARAAQHLTPTPAVGIKKCS